MTASGSASSRGKLAFVVGNDLDSVKLDEDEVVDGATTLLELLQPALGDPCLNALRRILAMTYTPEDNRPSEACVLDIRRLALKPLGELGKELELLKLPRVDADRSFERDNSAHVFMYTIIPAQELRRRVSVPGSRRRQRLADLFQHWPADPAVAALRRTLTMTFREATTPHQYDRILEEVRYVVAPVLVPCNPMLERMELEPVAMPTWRRFVDGIDTLDGSDGEGSPASDSAG